MKKLFCDKCGKETRQLYKFDVTIPDFIGTKPVSYPVNTSLDKCLCYSCMADSLDKLIKSFDLTNKITTEYIVEPNKSTAEKIVQKVADELANSTSVENFNKSTKAVGPSSPYTKSLYSYTDYMKNKEKDSCNCGDNCGCKDKKGEGSSKKSKIEIKPEIQFDIKEVNKENISKFIDEILTNLEKGLL